MSPRAAFNTPSDVQIIEGEVVVVGPEGIGHSFTPEAARETGRRLTGAADAAQDIADPAPAPEGDPPPVA
ncbi:MAG: hypothetical protein JWM33_1558 [Caulobacteraceae bacterium]|nr:hypothetical protein [Caulobacteraceae bacterium]